MTTKEKAEQLLERFEFEVRDIDGKVSHNKEEAIKCALICIEEIINACEYNYVEVYNTDWWNKVKQEVKK